MSNIATAEETALIERSLGVSPVLTRYLGIFNTTATGTELEGNTLTNEITSYTGNRPVITFGAAADVAGAQTCSNTGAVEYLVMPAITTAFVAVMDAATVGNVLWWAPLTINRTTAAGDTLRFAIGEVDFSLA